jgi:Spy/CpxP family protein refolding chaperone
MKIITKVATVALALMVAGAVMAADTPNDTPNKPSRGRHDEWRRGQDVFDVVKGLDLTADQQAKLSDLNKKYSPQLKALADKRDGVLTDQQKKDRDEAVKAAKAAGKKGQEVRRAGQDALKLTSDQQAKLSDLRKEGTALHKEIREKVLSLLTDEQKAKIKQHRGRQRGDKPAPDATQPTPATPAVQPTPATPAVQPKPTADAVQPKS